MKCPECSNESNITAKDVKKNGETYQYCYCPSCRSGFRVGIKEVKLDKYQAMVNLINNNPKLSKQEILCLHSKQGKHTISSASVYYRKVNNIMIAKRLEKIL